MVFESSSGQRETSYRRRHGCMSARGHDRHLDAVGTMARDLFSWGPVIAVPLVFSIPLSL